MRARMFHLRWNQLESDFIVKTTPQMKESKHENDWLQTISIDNCVVILQHFVVKCFIESKLILVCEWGSVTVVSVTS